MFKAKTVWTLRPFDEMLSIWLLIMMIVITQKMLIWTAHWKPRAATVPITSPPAAPMTTPDSYASTLLPLRWCHNERDHQPHDCLCNCLFRRRSKKISKLRASGLCEGNSPVTVEFPAQMAGSAENISIQWRHYASYGLVPTRWKHIKVIAHILFHENIFKNQF